LFWRAQIYEAIGNMPAAVRDWKKIEALPTGSAPQEMLDTAQAHIKMTSTPVPTATRTTTPSRTPRPGTGTATPTGETSPTTPSPSLTPTPE
jgi:hypothetical protein